MSDVSVATTPHYHVLPSPPADEGLDEDLNVVKKAMNYYIISFNYQALYRGFYILIPQLPSTSHTHTHTHTHTHAHTHTHSFIHFSPPHIHTPIPPLPSTSKLRSCLPTPSPAEEGKGRELGVDGGAFNGFVESAGNF